MRQMKGSFLLLALLLATGISELYASEPCESDDAVASTTPIEEFEAISIGETIESVRSRLGAPSCTESAKFDDGYAYHSDLYAFPDGRWAEVIYQDGKSTFGYLWNPHSKVPRILFGRPNYPSPNAKKIE